MSRNRTSRSALLLATVAAAVVLAHGLTLQAASTDQIKVMLLTGQMNKYHNWQVSSAILKRHLDAAGCFAVEVVKSPPRGADLSGLAPRFSKYDVVVLDYDGDQWSAKTKRAFVDYIQGGGGLVSYHSTDNAFPKWKEFNTMIGIGGWGGRDERWGPMVRWRDGQVVLDHSPGEAGAHPAKHDFPVTIRDPEHPITQGLPPVWMHAHDELYSKMRGPAKNLHVLATGVADQSLRGATPENEPVLLTVKYGQGRVFHTTLGHVGANDKEPLAQMDCVGFVVTFQRGVEWAATGKVTQPLPSDFPTASEISVRR